MATTATDHPLLIGGERVETGDWTEVRSPYSHDVIGRIAKGGAAETRSALSAAAAALQSSLLAHERARILDATAQLSATTFRADQMPSGNTKEGPAWAVRELTEERLVVFSL